VIREEAGTASGAETVPYVGRPKYLSQVEDLIGMPFFSDPTQEAAARTNLAELPQDEVRARAGLYVAGMRLLLTAQEQNKARRGTQLGLSDPQLGRFRRDNHDVIAGIRGELMTVDAGLTTDTVLALQEALGQQVAVRRVQVKNNRPKEPRQQLPPELLPVSAASKIITMGTGNIQNRVFPQGTEPRKLKLAANRPETCCTWGELRGIAEGTDIHGAPRMLRPGVEVDWDKLPKDDEAPNEEQIVYARELQERFVAQHKLKPGAGKIDVSAFPPARPYHISASRLSTLLGGGKNFIEDFSNGHGVPRFSRRQPDRARVIEYLFLEDAAEIWKAYNEIPFAGDNELPIVDVAREAGLVGVKGVYDSLTSVELGSLVVRRSSDPMKSGQILSHLIEPTLDRVIRRLRPIALPAHLLPAQYIKGIKKIEGGYIRRQRRDYDLPPTVLRLVGGKRNLPMVCYDWPSIKRIVGKLGAKDMQVDFDALPRGPHETDVDRIEYAREIQQQVLPREMLVGLLGDESAEPVIPPHIAERPAECPRLGITGVIYRAARFEGMQAELSTDPVTNVEVDETEDVIDDWLPAQRSHVRGEDFVSITYHLTAGEIATILGVSEEVAIDAARQVVDSSIYPAELDIRDVRFHGQELRAIREQLIGVPIEHYVRNYRMDEVTQQALQSFLIHHHFTLHEGYMSPTAAAFVERTIARADKITSAFTL